MWRARGRRITGEGMWRARARARERDYGPFGGRNAHRYYVRVYGDYTRNERLIGCIGISRVGAAIGSV